jgi:hypothetical protein
MTIMRHCRTLCIVYTCFTRLDLTENRHISVVATNKPSVHALLKLDLLGSLFYLCKPDIVIISKGVCVVHRFLFNFYKARIVSVTISFGGRSAAAAGSSRRQQPTTVG